MNITTSLQTDIQQTTEDIATYNKTMRECEDQLLGARTQLHKLEMQTVRLEDNMNQIQVSSTLVSRFSST